MKSSGSRAAGPPSVGFFRTAGPRGGGESLASGPDAAVRIGTWHGQRLRYEVSRPGIAPASGAIVLLEGEWSARRTLVLEPELPAGSLQLAVTGPEGRAVPEVELTLRRTGSLGGELELTAAGGELLTSVAAGEWTVTLTPADRSLQSTTLPLSVLPSTEATLSARLEHGAFLAFELGELDERTPKLILWGSSRKPRLELATGEVLDLTVLDLGGERRLPASGLAPGKRSTLGLAATGHPALPPGNHTLRMLPIVVGGETSWPVTLVAGETTVVPFHYPVAGE